MGGNISTEPVPTETPGESAPTVISSSNPPTSDQTSFFDPTPIYSETQNTSLQSVNETMIVDLDNDGDLDIVYESMEGSFFLSENGASSNYQEPIDLPTTLVGLTLTDTFSMAPGQILQICPTMLKAFTSSRTLKSLG